MGWTFVENSTWTVKGSNEVKVAGATVRKGPIDTLSHHVIGVTIEQVEEGRARVFQATVKEQVSREDGGAEDLALDGLALRVAGPPGDRTIERIDGERLKRKQRKWLEGQLGGSSDGQDVDPIALLIPEGPVPVGASWDLSMDAVQAFFGEDRVVIDRGASHARTTLREVRMVDGNDTGTFDVDVLIVPASMRNADLDEASMRITGTASVPVRGDVPYFSYDVVTEMQFVGVFKRGAIHAHVELDMQMHGVDARGPR